VTFFISNEIRRKPKKKRMIFHLHDEQKVKLKLTDLEPKLYK